MKGISLFASGGIGDLALRDVGVDVIVGNEFIFERAKVFEANFPDCQMLVGDIWALKNEIIETTKSRLGKQKLDFLIATPPCQGMSKNGRGKLLNMIRKGERPPNDPRNELIVPTIDIVKSLLPEVVVFENVIEMKDTLIIVDDEAVNILDYIRENLEPLGYKGVPHEIEFADYGVPQRRQRLITVYSKSKRLKQELLTKGALVPESTHSKETSGIKKKWVTVRDEIGDLEPLDSKNAKSAKGKTNSYHRVPTLDEKKYWWVASTPPESGAFDNQCVKCGYKGNNTHGSKHDKNGINRPTTSTPIYCEKCSELLPRPSVYENGKYRLMKGFTSAYRRMKWDLPSTALTTNLSYVSSDSKIHPSQNRVLSLYEAFRLHTISDFNYEWIRSDNKRVSDKLIREIIGESIPPRGLKVLLNQNLYQKVIIELILYHGMN